MPSEKKLGMKIFILAVMNAEIFNSRLESKDRVAFLDLLTDEHVIDDLAIHGLKH